MPEVWVRSALEVRPLARSDRTEHVDTQRAAHVVATGQHVPLGGHDDVETITGESVELIRPTLRDRHQVLTGDRWLCSHLATGRGHECQRGEGEDTAAVYRATAEQMRADRVSTAGSVDCA